MKLSARLSILFLLGALSPALAADPPAAKPADKPGCAVHVGGAVNAPRDFDVATLKQLAPRDSSPLDVVCASGATVGKVDNFRGVRLSDVIDATGIKTRGHKDARTMAVVARATDGHVVTFSWNELYNTEVGQQVVVAWEKDGKPLDPHEGQLLLISGKDIKTGPRHVRKLAAIEVVRMQ